MTHTLNGIRVGLATQVRETWRGRGKKKVTFTHSLYFMQINYTHTIMRGASQVLRFYR